MIVAVCKETFPGESRVALIPSTVPPLVNAGFEVLVETGAGRAAGFPDGQYAEKGAKVGPGRSDLSAADVLLQVRCAGANPNTPSSDLDLPLPDQVVIGMADPLGTPQAVEKLAARAAPCCWPPRSCRRCFS